MSPLCLTRRTYTSPHARSSRSGREHSRVRSTTRCVEVLLSRVLLSGESPLTSIEFLQEGYVQVIGADVNSNVMGPALHVANLVLTPISVGVSRISGVRIKISTSTTSNLPCTSGSSVSSPIQGIGGGGGNASAGLCAIIAGDAPILVGAQSVRAVKSHSENFPTAIAESRQWMSSSSSQQVRIPAFLQLAGRKRSLLQQVSLLTANGGLGTTSGQGVPGVDVYGDSNSDGLFDLSDYLFAQEFYNGATNLGCPAQGGTGCQARSGLTLWQVVVIVMVSS